MFNICLTFHYLHWRRERERLSAHTRKQTHSILCHIHLPWCECVCTCVTFWRSLFSDSFNFWIYLLTHCQFSVKLHSQLSRNEWSATSFFSSSLLHHLRVRCECMPNTIVFSSENILRSIYFKILLLFFLHRSRCQLLVSPSAFYLFRFPFWINFVTTCGPNNWKLNYVPT